MNDLNEDWVSGYASNQLLSFYESGDDSLATVEKILQLQNQQSSTPYEQIPSQLTVVNLPATGNSRSWTVKNVQDISKEDAIQLLAECFTSNSEIVKCCDSIQPEDFCVWVRTFWPWCQEYSFGICDEKGKLRAFAANLDHACSAINSDPNFPNYHPHIQDVSAYLDNMLLQVKNQMPDSTTPGVILEKGFFGTSAENTPTENVMLMNKLMEEFHYRAKNWGFIASISENTSPITQKLASLHGCLTLLSTDPRQYVNERGEKPFLKCADSRITIDIKYYV